MKQTLALMAHSVRRARALLVAMAAVLGSIQVAFALAANRMYESGTFSSIASLLPSFVRQMFGEALAGFLSFTGMVAFGYFHPMIIAALSALVIAFATEPVADIESRFLDLVLARPVPRAVVVARSALLVVLAPATMVGVMMLASLGAIRWMASPGAPAPAPRLVFALGVNVWAVMVCAGAFGLAVAATARRRATAAGIAGLVLVVLFLADYLSRVWTPAMWLARISPFHYYDAMAIVMSGGAFPARHVGVLLPAAAVGLAIAFGLFSRRDV